MVSPRTLHVEVLELRRRGKNHIGMHRRVGHELLDDHSKEIVAREASSDQRGVRLRDGRVRVPDHQPVYRRIERGIRQMLTESGHVECACWPAKIWPRRRALV